MTKGVTIPHLYPLAEFLVYAFGKTYLNLFRRFASDSEIAGSGTDTVGLEKEDETIIITSLYGDDRTEVRIPKAKFLQWLDYFEKNAHAVKDPNIKKLIFEFDEDWNCRLIPLYGE